MASRKWEVFFEKYSINRLNETTTKQHLHYIRDSATRNQTFKFASKVSKTSEPSRVTNPSTQQENYRYVVKFTLTKATVHDLDAAQRQFEHILNNVMIPAANKHGWSMIPGKIRTKDGGAEDSDDTSDAAEESNAEPRPKFVLPPLDDKALELFFSDVYERSAHIRLIYDSAKTFVQTGGKQRSGVLLWGPPAAGKTSLYQAFKGFMEQGSDGIERVAEIDGPTMSKAGLENYIIDKAEAGTLSEFLIIEEIEKQNMDNLLTLLSVMGSGIARKMNAHRGNQSAFAPCVIWATCNDENALKKFRNGALWSRFAHRLYCKRPSKELMNKILLNKIEERKGRKVWAAKAMEFAYETFKDVFGRELDDPREIIALLDGGRRLEDGSYQEDKLEIYKAEEEGMKARIVRPAREDDDFEDEEEPAGSYAVSARSKS